MALVHNGVGLGREIDLSKLCPPGKPPDNEIFTVMPKLGSPLTVTIKNNGMYTGDSTVFIGHGDLDESTRYLRIDKTGKWFSGDCKIDLENYIREEDSKKVRSCLAGGLRYPTLAGCSRTHSLACSLARSLARSLAHSLARSLFSAR